MSDNQEEPPGGTRRNNPPPYEGPPNADRIEVEADVHGGSLSDPEVSTGRRSRARSVSDVLGGIASKFRSSRASQPTSPKHTEETASTTETQANPQPSVNQSIHSIPQASNPQEPSKATIIKPSAPPLMVNQVLSMRPPRETDATTDESDHEGRRSTRKQNKGRMTPIIYYKYATAPSATDSEHSFRAIDSDDSEYFGTPIGAHKITKTMALSSYAALRPHKFDPEEKRHIARQVRKASTRAAVKEAIEQEEARALEESLEPRYATTPDKITKKIKKHPDIDSKQFEQAKKALKREFPNRFNNRYDLMNTFLDSYVELVNTHKLSTEQAERLLLSFFNDTMRNTLKNKLRLGSVQGAVDYLRKTKSNTLTIEKYKTDLFNWKLDRTKEIEPQLYELQDLQTNANPASPQETVDEKAKDRIETQLSALEYKNLQTEENIRRARRSGKGFTYDELVKYLARTIEVKPAKGKSNQEKEINKVEVQQKCTHSACSKATNEPATMHHIYSQALQPIPAYASMHNAPMGQFVAQAPSQTQPNFQANVNPQNPNGAFGMNPAQNYPPSGPKNAPPNASGENNPFMRPGHPEFATAAKTFNKDQLEGNTERKSDTTYIILTDGTIVPHDTIEVKPFSKRFSIFYKNPKTKRYELTRALVQHFHGKCSTCGLPGHRNADTICPFHNAADSWGICWKCRRGLHLANDCKYNSEYLAKNEERLPNYDRQT
jgi:hypothetical protein